MLAASFNPLVLKKLKIKNTAHCRCINIDSRDNIFILYIIIEVKNSWILMRKGFRIYAS